MSTENRELIEQEPKVLNMNDTVEVTLTPEGVRVFNEFHERQLQEVNNQIKKNGYPQLNYKPLELPLDTTKIELQLHRISEIFKSSMYNSPFKMEFTINGETFNFNSECEVLGNEESNTDGNHTRMPLWELLQRFDKNNKTFPMEFLFPV